MKDKTKIQLKIQYGFAPKHKKCLKADAEAPQRLNKTGVLFVFFYDWLFGMGEMVCLYTSEQIHGPQFISI